MKQIALMLIVMFFLFTACQKANSHLITLEEVLASFEEHQLSLIEKKVDNKDIFGMKLNRKKPSFYELDGKTVLIYIYNSTNAREKGLESFRKQTETANLVSFNVFEIKNVLLFYMYEKDLDSEIEEKFENIVYQLND